MRAHVTDNDELTPLIDSQSLKSKLKFSISIDRVLIDYSSRLYRNF